jgi:hypothetical protein
MTSSAKKSFMIVFFSLIALSYSSEVCDFTFTACPESFNGDTIVVPEQIVALSSSIKACSTTISSSITGSSLPPSIMFVIDHSGSMTGTGGDGKSNDPTGSRFTVVNSFLDSIYKKQPNAEVGVTVFNEHLFFDKSTSAYFSTYLNTLPTTYDGEPNQAYLKMLKLNQTYGTKKGIDVIKDVLATKDSTYNGNKFVTLVNQPSFKFAVSTNINVGFIAAKDAMKSAVNPAERQFVIFFSDGEPQGTNQAGLPINDFQKGTGMPTTFTVYFTPNNNAPTSIQTMTQNIRNNGYSSTNPKSNLWAIQTNHDALLNLLMDNVIKTILISGDPNSMVINGITSITATDTSFVFSDRFPLSATSPTTPFNATIKYKFTDPQTNKTRDSSIVLNFVVKRSKNATLPNYLEKNCWTQPVMNFYYNGTKISEATEEMSQLQIRLSSEQTLSSVSVGLKTSLESMPINLQSTTTDWQGNFLRATNTKAINDNILQHISGDSIIAIYRNPKIPLDTVRIAIAVRAQAAGIPVTAILRDTSGDGKIDKIDLSWTVDTVTLIPNLPDVKDFLQTATIKTTGGSTITLNPRSLIKTGDRSLAIILNENSGSGLETGWTSADIKLTDVVMTLQGNSFYISEIIDGSGPVISRAVYYPGSGAQPRDTLKVILSEPVNCATLTSSSPEQAFKYKGNDNNILTNSTFLANCTQEYVSEVKIILNQQSSGKVKPVEDSLGILSGTRKIVDNKGNYSTSPRNVVIEWGVKNDINIAVTNNPFTPGTPLNLPTEVSSIYGSLLNGKSGTIIAINSLKPLEKHPDGNFGSACIYDAVGNLVKSNLPIKQASKASTYGVVWDGTNMNNRIVGNGTYLMMFTTKSEGNTQKQKVKIGIKR